MEWVIGALVGFAIGGGAAWLFFGWRTKTSERLLETAKEELRETFKAAASDVVANNSQQFLQLANENFGRNLEKASGEFKERHEQFSALVKPLAENYQKLNPTIESLMQQNRDLVRETGKLSSALTDNRQVGSWGEIQLRRVVELARMTDYCDFVEQSASGEGLDRPDLTVRLPEGRAIVVDAKASTTAYLDAQQAEDEASANDAMQRHATALKTQVDELKTRLEEEIRKMERYRAERGG